MTKWVTACFQESQPPVFSGGAIDCTGGTLQVVDTDSLTAFGQLSSMDSAQAMQISMAVLLVWAAAWVFKVIARTLKETDNERSE